MISRSSPVRRPLLLGGIVCVALLLAWQLGSYQAKRSIELDNQALLDSMREAQVDVATLTRERDIARAAESELRDRLSEATRLSADERAELELYRRISNASQPIGLGVDNIEYLERDSGSPGVLEITLVQSRGRDRVTGSVQVTLKRDDQDLTILPKDDAAALRFDLRFFETLSIPLDLAAVGVPDTVLLSVAPDDDRHAAVSLERSWERVAK